MGFHYPSVQPCSSAAAGLQPLWSRTMMWRLCKSSGLPLSQIPVSLKLHLLCCCCLGCCDFNYRTCTCSFLIIKNEVWLLHIEEIQLCQYILVLRTSKAFLIGQVFMDVSFTRVYRNLCCISWRFINLFLLQLIKKV